MTYLYILSVVFQLVLFIGLWVFLFFLKQKTFDRWIPEKTSWLLMICIISTSISLLGIASYFAYSNSIKVDNPVVEKYGLPIRNIFPSMCEIKICPDKWEYCTKVNDEVIKNLDCDETLP